MDTQAEINMRVAQALGDAMIRNIALTIQIEALMANKANGSAQPNPSEEERKRAEMQADLATSSWA